MFWCWSRKDHEEDFLKKNISIATSYRQEQYNTSFYAKFDYNGSHVKCHSDKEWAEKWYNVNISVGNVNDISCNTSSVPIAKFGWWPIDKL